VDYPTYTIPVIGLAETIQNQSFIETKFFCIIQEDQHSVIEIRGIVDDFYFPCLRCESKVDQDNMVNVCDRAGAKENLTAVPVMLSDISEVENTIPLTNTSYLEFGQFSVAPEANSFTKLICRERLSLRNIS